MDMENRIAALEREVDAIRSELAVIRHEQLDHANAVELTARGARIETDILEMKEDISQLQKDMAQVQKDVAFLQKDVSQLQRDVSQLQRDVSQLQKDIAQMQKDTSQFQVQIREEIALVREDVALLRADFRGFAKELAFYATKADVRGLEGSIKGWMLGVALTVMSVNFAMNVIFLNFQKQAAAIEAAKAQLPAAPILPPRTAPAPGPAAPVK